MRAFTSVNALNFLAMKDFRVHSLDAKYIGPFEHLYIEFKKKEEKYKDEAEVHIFTGENGTGKSTILYLLTSYADTYLIRPRIQAANYTNFHNEINYSYSKGSDVPTSVGYKYSPNGLIIDGKDPAPLIKYIASINNPKAASKCSFAMFAYSGYRKIGNPKLESIKEIIESPLDSSLNFAISSNAQMLLQWIANTKAREALAFKNGEEKAAKDYELSLKKLQYAISEIIGSKIEFDLKSRPFDVFVEWNKTQLTFEVLPDGVKSIISWLGDLLMRLDRIEWETDMDIFDRNFILFLDEIDIHLHPAWQRKILPVVKKLFKNAQIFISTHSPFVVGSVKGAWVYRLKKEGQYAVLDGEPVLSDDAKSYDLVLAETFGIKERFGEAIENELKLFYDFRHRILINELPYENEEFQSLAYGLAERGIELESIIGMELRQLKRIKGIKENLHA